MKLKHILLFIVAAILAACSSEKRVATEPSLKEAFGNKFLIGVALNARQVAGKDSAATKLIKQHFNSIVAEDCMKSVNIHPEEDRYNFDAADSIVEYGEKNEMTVIGHCLVWHSQLAPWFCVDKEGKNVSPEVLKQRLKDHITTIVSRYKGRIKGWDVVNEAIETDGSYRKSKFYEILGEEYVPLAFQYAHEADPDAELYYNDFGMHHPGRRDGVVKLVKSLKEKGLRIDAVGLQGHMGMDYPSVEEFEKSMLAFASTGVKIMITEWEMSALPTVHDGANISDTVAFREAMNPYPDALPDSVSKIWNARMKAFFDLFIRHADIMDRVTVWGVSDVDSWKNDFPVRGRKEYPLLFDRNHEPKPFLRELLSPKTAIFDNFTYSVEGEEQKQADAEGSQLTNPLLPGCYPDPSICRVGDDYYLVNSSFAFYPGVPIWHSNNLKDWKQLGYVLNRPSQLPLKDGLRISGGIYAPDIKYNPHNKLFYMITTAVDGGGNFFVTTDNPKKGEWSDPIFLPEVGGIDPGFLFDEDGKAYIVNNDAPAGKPEYSGHRAIWIREFDWKNNCTVGEQKVIIDGGVDKSQHPSWIEGPHLYHINGTYYLMAAEGGTGPNHCEVIFSASSPFGPFKPCNINPILTQRDLPQDRTNPVTCTGHADLVQTPSGDWYAVFLAVRPYRNGHDVMGRETFLLPVNWKDGQPIILPAGKTIRYTNRTLAPTPLWTTDGLANEAFFIRTPQNSYYEIDKSGKLALTARSIKINDRQQPSAIGRWITNNEFDAQTTVSFLPTAPEDFAGIILFHNDECNIRFGKTLDAQDQPCLKLTVSSRSQNKRNTDTAAETTVSLKQSDADKKIYLKVTGNETQTTDKGVYYTFSYSFSPKQDWTQVGEPISADLLSTQTAGGFTGTMVGIYTTGDYNKPGDYNKMEKEK